MADIYCVNLGETMREVFLAEAKRYPYGEALFVLPGRMLLQKVCEQGGVRAVNIDFLPNEILRANRQERLLAISRRTQSLLIQLLLEQMLERGELRYFAPLVKQAEFVEAVMGLIGELSRSCVPPEELSVAFTHWNREDNYAQKDKELCLVYQRYQALLTAAGWYDKDGLYRLAITELQKATVVVPWKKLYFSEFYQFDRLQQELLQALAQHCALDLGIVYEEGRGRLSATTLPVIDALVGAGFHKHIVQVQSSRAAALTHFCQHWQRDEDRFLPPQTAFRLLEAGSATGEMREVIKRIKEQLRSGVTVQDILVVVRSMKNYNGMKNLFDEYGVPTALPAVAGFASQPLVEYVRVLLQACIDQYSAEACFTVLEATFAKLLYSFDGESLSVLKTRQYFANALALRQYLEQSALASEQKNELNQIFVWLEAMPQYATCAQYCQTLRTLVETWQLGVILGREYQQEHLDFLQLKNILATEKTFYEVLVELEMAYEESGLGKKNLSLADFVTLWQQLTREKQITLIAGNNRGIQVVEAATTQGLCFKHIYLLGLREGEFPALKQENWLYTDQERKLLTDYGVELRNTIVFSSEDEYFFASAVAMATETVTLSYYVDDTAGRSGYIETLLESFTELVPVKASEPQEASDCWSEQQLLQHLCTKTSWGEAERQWLLARLGGDYEARRVLDTVRWQSDSPYQGYLTQPVALTTGKRLGQCFSASELEVYAACPFRFLVGRVWQLAPWQEKDGNIEPSVQGNLYHEVLASFLSKHLQENISKLASDALGTELQNIYKHTYGLYQEQGKIATSDFTALEKRQDEKKLKRWLASEQKYQAQLDSKLLPHYVEWSFGLDKSEAPALQREIGGETICFRGRIDRIDEDSSGLVITDYKLSKIPAVKELELGLDLQLPLYLLAAEELLHKEQQFLSGGYYSLSAAKRQGGYWLEEAKILPWVTRVSSKPWPVFKEEIETSLVKYVSGMKSGYYALAPVKGCPAYCPGKDICRYTVGKTELESGEVDV
ncbi:MAG: PD-(D/E)XK nuclease family protein [Acidaminococcaceae bacterium]